MKKVQFFILLFAHQILAETSPYATIVGPVCFADGIGRQAISFIECLKDSVSVNFMSSRDVVDMQDIPTDLQPLIANRSRNHGPVMIFEDTLDNFPESLKHTSSTIKIAYTMFEKEQLPHEWVSILNNYFDAAVVPDEFLIDVYQKSGVKIPVFVLPLSLYLEPFMAKEPRKEPGKPFVFGTSGQLSNRKDQMTLLEAFAKEFGNNPDVCLKIHGRSGSEYAKQLSSRITELNLTNVQVVSKQLNWKEYCDFMGSLDCFVSLSRGEGFSITPREALACGIPCIISDNTAHKTICKTGLVRAVPSYKVRSSTTRSYQDHEPFDFFCKIGDVQIFIKDVVINYYEYAKQAILSKLWVSRYCHSNLKDRYCTLVKPKSIIYGPRNEIADNYLMCNSEKLCQKYRTVLDSECC